MSSVTNRGIAPPLLELKGITKAFPGVVANDSIDLKLDAGEIHALLGENGAGKSTLVKIIYGYYQADLGSVFWRGNEVRFQNPSQARQMGIEMVFQHFSLFDAMTVMENVELVVAPIAGQSIADRINFISEEYGLELDPDRYIHSLSVGERQRVEIARCLMQSPELLIMDEPTSVLTPQEADKLFDVLRKLSSDGCAVLYISHKLDEIKALCHRATILRQGKFITEIDPTEVEPSRMAELMIGSSLAETAASHAPTGKTVFRVQGLNRRGETERSITLRDISFEVRAGEVFGIAGVAGNGQSELMENLSGEEVCAANEMIQLNGQAVGKLSIRARRGLGIAVVPEERLQHGLITRMSLVENTFLGDHKRYKLSNGTFLNYSNARQHAQRIADGFDVRHAGLNNDAGSLSGGNQQKFLVGREIFQNPRVLLAAQPTWGIDAGSQRAIHQSLLDLAASGTAVLIISPDLDELLTLCDRIAVIFAGRLSEPRAVTDLTAETIGLLMGGAEALTG